MTVFANVQAPMLAGAGLRADRQSGAVGGRRRGKFRLSSTPPAEQTVSASMRALSAATMPALSFELEKTEHRNAVRRALLFKADCAAVSAGSKASMQRRLEAMRRARARTSKRPAEQLQKASKWCLTVSRTVTSTAVLVPRASMDTLVGEDSEARIMERANPASIRAESCKAQFASCREGAKVGGILQLIVPVDEQSVFDCRRDRAQ